MSSIYWDEALKRKPDKSYNPCFVWNVSNLNEFRFMDNVLQQMVHVTYQYEQEILVMGSWTNRIQESFWMNVPHYSSEGEAKDE